MTFKKSLISKRIRKKKGSNKPVASVDAARTRRRRVKKKQKKGGKKGKTVKKSTLPNKWIRL